MRKKIWVAGLLAAVLVLSLLAGCGKQEAAQPVSEKGETSAEETAADAGIKRTAKDNAQIQIDDESIATRKVPENGTPINIRFGDDAVITGVLNGSETAQAFIKKLPYTIHMGHYAHDFCGVTEELPYDEEAEHYGWLNGDIDYATDAPYFTILYKDEDISEQYGYQVNIGVITSPLSELDALGGSYDVTVELAEQESAEAAPEDSEAVKAETSNKAASTTPQTPSNQNAVKSEPDGTESVKAETTAVPAGGTETEGNAAEAESEAEKVSEAKEFYITVNGTTMTAVFESNSSADAFRKLLESGPVSVSLSDYGNFEKVGSLGTSLTTNDTKITTQPGDVILYQANQITIYYDKNTWTFTKLGHIQGLSQDDLKKVLGDGSVTAVFSLEK